MIDEDCILQTLRSQLFEYLFNVAYLYIYTSSCNRKKTEKSLKAVSNTVLGLLESYDYREDITEKTSKEECKRLKDVLNDNYS